MNQEERKYYNDYFGFDPESDLIKESTYMHYDGALAGYERTFEFSDEDRVLRENNLFLVVGAYLCRGAYMDLDGLHFTKKPTVALRVHIASKETKLFSSVDCIHTGTQVDSYEKIEEIALEDPKNYRFWAESKEVNISLQSHFAAMISWIAGVLELGLLNTMKMSYDYNIVTMPGFNFHLHMQFIRAINTVSFKAGCAMVGDMLIFLHEMGGTEWMEQRYELLLDAYGYRWFQRGQYASFERYANEDPNMLEILRTVFPNKTRSLEYFAIRNGNETVIRYLFNKGVNVIHAQRIPLDILKHYIDQLPDGDVEEYIDPENNPCSRCGNIEQLCCFPKVVNLVYDRIKRYYDRIHWIIRLYLVRSHRSRVNGGLGIVSELLDLQLKDSRKEIRTIAEKIRTMLFEDYQVTKN